MQLARWRVLSPRGRRRLAIPEARQVLILHKELLELLRKPMPKQQIGARAQIAKGVIGQEV